MELFGRYKTDKPIGLPEVRIRAADPNLYFAPPRKD